MFATTITQFTLLCTNFEDDLVTIFSTSSVIVVQNHFALISGRCVLPCTWLYNWNDFLQGIRPDRPRILYMRFISELLPEPENPTKSIVLTGGISISSFLIPPVGTQKSPERYPRSLCRSSFSPSGAIKANLSNSLSSLSLGVRMETSGKSSLSLAHSSNFAAVLHQQYANLHDSQSSSSTQETWLFISSLRSPSIRSEQ
ncbi:hypothetical protein QQP08_001817 [Theobroma cacao]|nr:hypothetical protein QQP08_001817 [Theobroma cacao]